jgi:hypothetical protein
MEVPGICGYNPYYTGKQQNLPGVIPLDACPQLLFAFSRAGAYISCFHA